MCPPHARQLAGLTEIVETVKDAGPGRHAFFVAIHPEVDRLELIGIGKVVERAALLLVHADQQVVVAGWKQQVVRHGNSVER